MMPNARQQSLLDYLGVSPARYKTEGASDALYDEGKAEAEAFKIAHPGKQPASGGCKLLLGHFRPGVALDNLDREDGFKLVSEVFKIKANDLVDLYVNHDFTMDMIDKLWRIQSREQGAALVANVRKRGREGNAERHPSHLHILPHEPSQ